jgi:hypothetical protein
MGAGTQFSILGPVTVARNGIAVKIGGRRLSLLAIFLLHPNVEWRLQSSCSGTCSLPLVGEAAAISPEQFAAVQALAGTLCVVWVEQGRAREMVDEARQFVADLPHMFLHDGRACRCSSLKRAKRMRHEPRSIASLTPVSAQCDATRTGPFAWPRRPKTCGRLNDCDRAGPVYEQLLPFDGRFVVLGDGYAVWCSVAKSLGILARAGRRLDAARAHLETALVAHQAAGAAALAPRTRAELTTALSAPSFRHQQSSPRRSWPTCASVTFAEEWFTATRRPRARFAS